MSGLGRRLGGICSARESAGRGLRGSEEQAVCTSQRCAGGQLRGVLECSNAAAEEQISQLKTVGDDARSTEAQPGAARDLRRTPG